ncbi:hypothetical protein BSS2_I0952 [Brucella suis bv. 1 str. S2]|uniref:BrnT family toxin n=11 Tax=Brucella TaxID=234 RepID=A9MAZ2_BRUC2|nr:conserved hypothetical protein [Brucella suis 1330]ABX62045.1 Hypothetical protein BCAN_A0992 [Brucella canis ATCC 23365]ABY38078.1 Hypothetical protein BSUIS_A1019 [Brucella suis ATCC 23445]ACU47959.1 hypothetical protein BMI_I976 [Brucella microti CCM 4915]AEK54291.1 hypothetical protein BPI_I1014 [Brucella pinnipedialis B2/94]AEU05985.1 hypothetical protein BSVBI22_A0971 [Brucella suis VBI22]AHN46609.1 hypothetical protein BSS2_I0952 [Brucella suis bv. 1 str. S2]EEH14504.1 Hypothetical
MYVQKILFVCTIIIASPDELLYIRFMKIIWDEPKRQTNIAKHGLDFADLHFEFFLSAKVFPTKADRLMAIGEFNGLIIIAVIFKPVGSEALSVISMRPASQKERKL